VGVLCFALLAWGHLGLGALLIPPAPTAAQQTVVAGPYHVVLALDSGQLTVKGPNAISFRVQEQSGQMVKNASVQVALEMTTMPMSAPTVSAHPQSTGQYLAQPLFSMAGNWRLTVTIVVAGQPGVQATFPVSVRWYRLCCRDGSIIV
jgi:nitrogen fixation protein FixH